MVAGFELVRGSPAELLLDALGVVPAIDIGEQGILCLVAGAPGRETSSVFNVEKKFSINALS
jgi:hypothetical protein